MAGIVLATDGSEYAEKAGAQAIELAADRDVPLHVLCVVDRREFDETALSSGELACIQAEDRGHECVATVADEAEATGLDVTTTVCHGIPEDDIVEYADEIEADTIVIGQHGDHTVHLGGVGRRIEDNSTRETMVVSS